MKNEKIGERDVLKSTALWLLGEKWKIVNISMPKGQGLGEQAFRSALDTEIRNLDITHTGLSNSSGGPDIIAKKEAVLWKIECKGLGEGSQPTLRNNFDRALASTVSYFDSAENLRLGLAMPKNPTYEGLIGTRIPQALRQAINMWIFIYDPHTETMEEYPPERIFSNRASRQFMPIQVERPF